VIKKILKTYIILLIFFAPTLAQEASTSGLQNLDPDPLINQLLNNLSSGGVVSELVAPSPAQTVDVPNEQNGLETILTPVNPEPVSPANAAASPTVPAVVANTLSSSIVVPIENSDSSVSQDSSGQRTEQALPAAVAPVPIDKTEDTSVTNSTLAPQTDTQAQESPFDDSVRNVAQLKPRLFDIAWNDSEVYKVNLIPSAWSSLDRVAGSSIYHIHLDIAEDLRQLNAKQEILVRNSEVVDLDRLYFQLFPNL